MYKKQNTNLKGNWNEIATHIVKTRTRIQVASHAYKYLKKVKRELKNRVSKRRVVNQKEAPWKKVMISSLLNSDTL